ncbi:unnamed protein product [Owenia fusiformis]|uniref:GATOR complex protein NPRL3 n=1 Tax=Owenia fusiformis TaxID=6347 RepID=A0A8J1UPP2_OWEFU|nr:unnamed protein product [Owenia fusiformis]
MDDIKPIGVILVTSGSKGDRLLFRYPFESGECETNSKSQQSNNPYAVQISEDIHDLRKAPASSLANGNLFGYSETVLANLLAVKSTLCGRKFELKIDDVILVGHPTLLEVASSSQQQSSMISFNVVFLLKSNAHTSLINSYHDLAKQIAIALRHEERRCSYLNREKDIMVAVQDELASMPEDCLVSPFKLILERSPLAKHFKHIYDKLCSNGIVHLHINNWIEVNFCLPHKIHNSTGDSVKIQPEAVNKCIIALRPYHGILLTVDENKLLESLPPDCSPALIRLVKMASPIKSLQKLASDTDISLQQVFQLVSHLVYWAKAMIIYPLCESNVYVLSPDTNTFKNSELVEKFAEEFQGVALSKILAEFSLPTPLGEHQDVLGLPQQQAQKIQMVVWMLQHRLLVQLHTYIFLLPSSDHSYTGKQKQSSSGPPLRKLSHPTGQFRTSASAEELPQILRTTLSASDVSLVMEAGSSPVDEGSVFNKYKPVSETSPPAPAAPLSPNGEVVLSKLAPPLREKILNLPATRNTEDLRLFVKLFPYFNGYHHLEEIMYYENMRRSQLLMLVDKFRDILVTCTHPEPHTNYHIKF